MITVGLFVRSSDAQPHWMDLPGHPETMLPSGQHIILLVVQVGQTNTVSAPKHLGQISL